MIDLTCDRCGKTLLLGEDVRYIVNIQVFAAYDPMELTADDLARDHRAELEALVEKLKRMDPEEAQDSVYRDFTFQLCPACRKAYLKDPLGMQSHEPDGEEKE